MEVERSVRHDDSRAALTGCGYIDVKSSTGVQGLVGSLHPLNIASQTCATSMFSDAVLAIGAVRKCIGGLYHLRLLTI